MRVATLLVLLPLTLQFGCFLQSKKQSASAPPGGSQLLLRDRVLIDRVGNGNAARLQFETAQPALCEFSYTPQTTGVPDPNQPPVTSQCSSPETPRTQFVEKIANLRTDLLYRITITAWATGSDKSHGDSIVVDEQPTGQGTATDQHTTNGAVNGGDLGVPSTYETLFIARLDLPLKSAEVYRTALGEASSPAKIKEKFVRQTGCQKGSIPFESAFRTAAPDLQLTNLATKDLATAAGKAHPDFPPRQLLTYSSINLSLDTWTILAQLNGTDLNIGVRPINSIANLEMESASTVAFDPPSLSKVSDPLKIDPSKPLKISWTVTGNLLDSAYLSVQIGRPGYVKAIYCIFPAADRTGSFDPALLQSLDDGTYVIAAELSTNQLVAKYSFVVATADWRMGRITK